MKFYGGLIFYGGKILAGPFVGLRKACLAPGSQFYVKQLYQFHLQIKERNVEANFLRLSMFFNVDKKDFLCGRSTDLCVASLLAR